MGVDKVHGLKKSETETGFAFASSNAFGKNIEMLRNPVADQIERIYEQAKMVQTVVQKAAANPGRTGCATVALGFGLSQFFSGHFMTGGALTMLGASELKNVFWSDGNSDLKRLFNNIHADVGTIEKLQTANSASCGLVQDHLVEIQQEVVSLQGQLTKISAIHEEGLSQVAEKKEEAIRLNQEAKIAYDTAISLFQKTKTEIASAQEHYGKCGECVGIIQELTTQKNVKDSPQDQVLTLMGVVREASDANFDGRTSLDNSIQLFADAIKKLHEASDLKNKASAVAELAVQLAESSMNSANIHASHKNSCSEKIKAAQEEMTKIQKRNTQIKDVMAELRRDVLEAREEAQSRWSLSEVFLSVATAACLTSPTTVMGAAGLTAIAASVGYAYRSRSELAAAVSFAYRSAMKIQEIVPEPMKPNELLRAQFSKTSSGLWGHYVQGRSSATVGTMEINLGDVIALPFDLNDSRDPIDRLALSSLLETMNERLTQKTLNPDRCLEILKELKSCTLKKNFTEIKLLGKSHSISVALALLEEQCAELKIPVVVPSEALRAEEQVVA
jgi:hypothetical protein